MANLITKSDILSSAIDIFFLLSRGHKHPGKQTSNAPTRIPAQHFPLPPLSLKAFFGNLSYTSRKQLFLLFTLFFLMYKWRTITHNSVRQIRMLYYNSTAMKKRRRSRKEDGTKRALYAILARNCRFA